LLDHKFTSQYRPTPLTLPKNVLKILWETSTTRNLHSIIQILITLSKIQRTPFEILWTTSWSIAFLTSFFNPKCCWMQIKSLGHLKYRAFLLIIFTYIYLASILPHKFNLNGSYSVYVFGIYSPGFAGIDENRGISQCCKFLSLWKVHNSIGSGALHFKIYLQKPKWKYIFPRIPSYLFDLSHDYVLNAAHPYVVMFWHGDEALGSIKSKKSRAAE
jgi:hypothetical protein